MTHSPDLPPDYIDGLQMIPDHKLLLQAMHAYKALLAVINEHTDNDTGMHVTGDALPAMCEDILRTTACLTAFCQRYFTNPAHQAEAERAATQN